LTSLIELIESFKKETHTETECTNQNNNDTNQNTKMVKCNNLIYKSYMRDLEYDFLDERLDGEEEKESVKDQLLKLSRRFNLDLSPNLFYSRGEFIELLISSDTSKYCEFRMVSQIMTRNEHGIIEKVGIENSKNSVIL